MPGGSHENMRAWEPEEDQTIIELLEELGPKWSKIVQALPGRSVSSVRNRWQRIEKGRKLRMNGMESKNRCQQCGEPKRGHVCMARLKNRGETGETADEASVLWENARQGGYSSSPAMSRQSSYSGGAPTVSRQSSLVSAVTLPRVALEDDPEVAPEDATIPLLSSMKSGPRICNELGFEALALAASQLAEREQERQSGLACPEMMSVGMAEQPMVLSFESSSGADLPQLGRLPSYSSLHPSLRLPPQTTLLSGTVLSNGDDGEGAVVLYDDAGAEKGAREGGASSSDDGAREQPPALQGEARSEAGATPAVLQRAVLKREGRCETVDFNSEGTCSSSTASSQDGGDWPVAADAKAGA